MAVGTKDLAPEQLRGLDDTKLADELKKAKEELFNLRFQSATGQLDNHGRLRAVKKDIARIYTEMRERELGIGSAPAAPKAPEKAEKVEKKAAKADKKADKAEKAEKADKPEKAVSDQASERNYRKTRQGYVVSDKMDKTVVVEVEDRVKHALYSKVIRRTSKVKVHDEQNAAGVGDRVLIMETRPLSATKHWRIVEILEKAK